MSGVTESNTTARQLWGPEADRAAATFHSSGAPIPAGVIRWLRRVKGAAATANGTLGLAVSASATVLNPKIGYDLAGAILGHARRTGSTLRDAALEHRVDEALLDEILDPRRIASGNRGTTSHDFDGAA